MYKFRPNRKKFIHFADTREYAIYINGLGEMDAPVSLKLVKYNNLADLYYQYKVKNVH